MIKDKERQATSTKYYASANDIDYSIFVGTQSLNKGTVKSTICSCSEIVEDPDTNEVLGTITVSIKYNIPQEILERMSKTSIQAITKRNAFLAWYGVSSDDVVYGPIEVGDKDAYDANIIQYSV